MISEAGEAGYQGGALLKALSSDAGIKTQGYGFGWSDFERLFLHLICCGP
jgi:hypothetical protein